MSEAALREMDTGDIPALVELEKACFPSPWTAGMFLTQIALGDLAVNLVAVDDDGISGYVTGWIGYRELHILSIAVAPEKRGRGMADSLLKEVTSRSVRSGCEKVILEVRVGNARARRFYERSGFREIGLRKRYYADNGEDAIVMEKDIP